MNRQLESFHPNRRTFLSAIGLGTAVAAAPAFIANAATPLSRDWSSVEAAAKAAIQSRYTPGIGLAVFKDRHPIFVKGFGLANIETETPVETDSVFRIASVTKQFVGALLLILERDQKLSLEDRLSRYFPDFPRADQITLYQLATHTAGLANYPSTPNAPVEERLDYYDDASFLDLLKSPDPLFHSEPGVEERYSNTGYGLLTLIINKVCDDWYGTVLNDRFFEPMGLKSLAVDQAVAVVPKRVSGYMPLEGQPSGFINAPFISMSYVSGAGALRSTATDLCQWHQALMAGEVLNASEVERLLAPVNTRSGLSYYGIGLKSRETFGTFRHQETLSHGGRLNGFATHLWSFPKKKISVAVLFNSDGTGQEDFAPAFDKVRDSATQIAGMSPTV